MCKSSLYFLCLVCIIAVALAGCSGQDDRNECKTASSSQSGSPPTITGKPDEIASPGLPYSFTPVANDGEGDALSFCVEGLPPWADFDAENGELSGEPDFGDLGTFGDIVISVTDRRTLVSLPVFNIRVVTAGATGLATLKWTAPAQYSDGTQLTRLAGFKIYYGSSADRLPYVEIINDPDIVAYTVDNLTPGEWFFVVTAFDSSHRESEFSAATSMMIE